jgi:glucosyl-3-phosphoglycerate synthase
MGRPSGEEGDVHHKTAAWFAASTSSGCDWDRHKLQEAKDGTTVSIVLPARNEAETVGSIVQRLRSQLVDDVPLVDEILVVDSGSEDGTVEAAEEAGATVVGQQAILPGLGDRAGKGEALWKSLCATHGDIVAFIDADLHDFDPQFAVGLVGPLLAYQDVQFVKGFYDRPLSTGQQVLPAGGGRVTELLARPLLNLHYPDLAGFVQPLAGEYAARRTLLERLPFMSGYGVEIAMMVDVYELVGLEAMAQVDLGQRTHRNSTDAALGRMAAQVYLALLSRLERYGKATFAAPPCELLTQFTRSGDAFASEVSHVGVSERPPMAGVEEYRARPSGQRR